jgi:ribosomal protein L29
MLSIQELRSSSKKELLLELLKARKEMLKIRISLKTKHEKDTSKARKQKRLIAQILTLLKDAGTEPVAKAVKTSVSEVATKSEEKKPSAKKVVAKKPVAKKIPKA